ncbi:MAG: hypothetical protein IKH16_08135 [Selenomonadaceae bacterium]|nr:hypothetical protein [Selenomonadaceae bacterium]
MKQMIFTIMDDESCYFQVKGGAINFQEIIRAAAALMANSAKKGLEKKAIREDEIEHFFGECVKTARLTLAEMRKKG